MEATKQWQWLVEQQRAGEEMERLGHYEDAIRKYQQIFDHDQSWGNGWVCLALGELYEKLHHDDAAEAYFEKSVEANNDPPNPNYRSNFAAFLLEKGKPEKALKYYLKALEVAVGLSMTAVVPAITDGIRAAAKGIGLPQEEVDAKIAEISTTGKKGPT